jgi:hypothetical protein
MKFVHIKIDVFRIELPKIKIKVFSELQLFWSQKLEFKKVLKTTYLIRTGSPSSRFLVLRQNFLAE